jgi:hypothetical protein
MQDGWTKVMIEFRLMEAIRVLESVNVGPLGPSTKTSNYPDPVLSYVELLGAVEGRFVRKTRPKIGHVKVGQVTYGSAFEDGEEWVEDVTELRCLDMGEEVVTTYRDVDPATGKVDLSFVPQTHWAKGFARPAIPSKAALTRAGEVLGWQSRGGNWLRHLKGHKQLVDVLWLIYGRDLSLHDAAMAFSRWRKVRKPYSRATLGRWRDNALACISKGLHAEKSRPTLFEQRLEMEAREVKKKNHLTMRHMRQILQANQ